MADREIERMKKKWQKNKTIDTEYNILHFIFFICLILYSMCVWIQDEKCMFICSNTASPSMCHTFRYISLVGSFIHVIWIEDMNNKKKMSWKLHSKRKQQQKKKRNTQVHVLYVLLSDCESVFFCLFVWISFSVTRCWKWIERVKEPRETKHAYTQKPQRISRETIFCFAQTASIETRYVVLSYCCRTQSQKHSKRMAERVNERMNETENKKNNSTRKKTCSINFL